MDFAPGDRVDRYVLVQPLGEGGQGSVWRAEDPLSPGQPRAIKLVPLVLARPNDVERVRREARALAKLEHPSLVRCHALFEDLKHSALGVVMDFVDGSSLRAAADEPWMTDQHRVAALRHIAQALSYVHQQGVVHRDLKLDNVLVTRAFWDTPDKAGSIKVVDFGIAKVSDGSHALTAIDTIVGTIAYLSPELLDPAFFRSNGATAAADVFAFGVVAWKLLVGGHPTGLPAGAGIVDYGAAYRTAASREPAWPADVPPGPWGNLLSDCLRVRASERIADGVRLAERCEKTGEFSTGKKSGALATEPADPLAPTAEIEPQPDRAARARAISHRQPAIARRERESLSNIDAPKPAPKTPPDAETLISDPTAPTAQAPPSKATAIAIGAVLLAVLGGAGLVFFRPSPAPPSPLLPTASQPVARGPLPVATAHRPDAETDAADAADEGVVESPTRPAGCSADQPVCECCASGRDCGPGRCDDDLNPMESWHLRLGAGAIEGTAIGSAALDVELCVRIARFKDPPTCTKLNTPDAVNSRLPYVSGAELQGNGVELELKRPSDAGGQTLRALLKRKLTRLALCEGLEVDQWSGADPGSGSAKLRLFLDDPGAPPEACSSQ